MNDFRRFLIILLIILLIIAIILHLTSPNISPKKYVPPECSFDSDCCGSEICYCGKCVPGEAPIPCPNNWTVTIDDAYNTNAQIAGERLGSVYVEPGSGKVIASGDGWNIYRFNRDGTLDATFGTAGILDTSIPGFSPPDSPYISEANGWYQIIVDGFIWVVGNPFDIGFNHSRMAVLKYDSNGVLDPTFGVGGRWIDARDTIASEAYAIDFDAAGNVYIGGHDEFLTNVNMHCVVKLFPDGTLDTSFGANGYARIHLLPGNADPEGELRGVHVQSDGKIVGGGWFTAFNDADDIGFGVVRFNTDGSLDTSFGESGGWTLQPFDEAQPFLDAFAYNSTMLDDFIYVSGYTETFPPSSRANTVMKFTPDGVLDTTWGDNDTGIVRFKVEPNAPAFIDQSESVEIPCDGGNFICGRTGFEGTPDQQAFAYKLDPNGEIDTNFANMGIYLGGQFSSFDQMTTYNNGNVFEVYAVGAGPGGDGTFGTVTKFTFVNSLT